jgi:hypothetical protein
MIFTRKSSIVGVLPGGLGQSEPVCYTQSPPASEGGGAEGIMTMQHKGVGLVEWIIRRQQSWNFGSDSYYLLWDQATQFWISFSLENSAVIVRLHLLTLRFTMCELLKPSRGHKMSNQVWNWSTGKPHSHSLKMVIYLFIHSFIQFLVSKYLLCYRVYALHWGLRNE